MRESGIEAFGCVNAGILAHRAWFFRQEIGTRQIAFVIMKLVRANALFCVTQEIVALRGQRDIAKALELVRFVCFGRDDTYHRLAIQRIV